MIYKAYMVLNIPKIKYKVGYAILELIKGTTSAHVYEKAKNEQQCLRDLIKKGFMQIEQDNPDMPNEKRKQLEDRLHQEIQKANRIEDAFAIISDFPYNYHEYV